MRWPLLFALAGCQKLLGLEQVPPPPPDAPPCVMPIISDTFDSGSPCSSWGFPITDMFNTNVRLAGGDLVISPAPNSHVTNGGCAANGPIAFTADGGVFAQVVSLPDGGEYMQFQGFYDKTDVIEIAWSTTEVRFDVNGTMVDRTLFDPAQTQWVRMRPTPGGFSVVAETSADALHWKEFARSDVAAPPEVTMYLLGGTYTDEPTPKDIRFATFDVCPPL